ncbi:amidase [Virgibacillus byunsanensis]|uniref:Amidase n=1 Tax=Virgibacillus byunsanensis TaxID=570945 RepID=A0ABW3LHK2_9BACI
MSEKKLDELLFKSIEEIGQLYRNKEVSPYEITKATIERLNTLEPKLNAFITVLSEEALSQAKKAEDAFLKNKEVGKLYGIPVSLKDIFDTKGIRTSLGSRIMRDYVPNKNSHVYDAFLKAGAIVVGKNNMLEFAYGSVHPDYGQCNNPWDINHTAGGSSSGSASSVAAGIGFASIGTDTGGSIRVPSSFCGIVGLKPTYNAVPREGVFPLSNSLDHVGPMTRTVRDNVIVLEHITSKKFNYESIFSNTLNGVRVGVVRSLTDSIHHTEVKQLIDKAILRIKDLGADVIDVSIPGIEIIERAAMPILLAEATSYHTKWEDRTSDYAEGTYKNLKEGYNVSALSYLESLQIKNSFTASIYEAFNQVDILLCPTVPYPATEKDPSFKDGDIDISQRTIPFNMSGNPALSISAGNTSENMPVGLQIVGKHHDEGVVYQVANAFQVATGGYNKPKL